MLRISPSMWHAKRVRRPARRPAMDDGLNGLSERDGVAAKQAGLPADAAGGPPWPLSERPGFPARRLHQIHVSLFAELCAEFRITPLQYSLLSRLAEIGEADQTTLANAV